MPTKMFVGVREGLLQRNRDGVYTFHSFSSSCSFYSEFGDLVKLNSSHILDPVLNVANP